MKRLSEITQHRQPITELTAFQDPPTVLIMRRKGIRLFPNGQRVATYKNDNLDLEVAIPYDPQTLGQHRISTVGTSIGESHQYNADAVDKAIRASKPKIGNRERKLIHRLLKGRLPSDPTTHGPKDHAVSRPMKALLTGEETLVEGDPHKTFPNAYFVHGLDKDGNRVYFTGRASDFISPHGEHAFRYDTHKQAHERATMLNKGMAQHGVHFTVLKPPHMREETEIQEATIHSLHAIASRKRPAMVRFGNGASAMVHHGTAARIMKLHSLMHKRNKHKIETFVNSSPDGLKKVIDFADVHLK